LAKKAVKHTGPEEDNYAKKTLRTLMDSPCYVTVKLDGTNVGIDNKGLVVGRNTVIKEGQSY